MSWALAALCTVTTLGLGLPWARVLTSPRSTIGLIADASSLDRLDSGWRLLILCAWLSIPVISAAVLLAAAAPRPFAAAVVALPLGPITVGASVAIATHLPGEILWGAWITMGAGVAATSTALALLCTTRA